MSAISQVWPFERAELGMVLQERGGRVVRTFETERGRFVLKATSRSADVVDSDTSVLAFLTSRGLGIAPRLVKTRSGENFAAIDGNLAYVMEFVEGEPLDSSEASHRELGCLAGRIGAEQGYRRPSPIVYRAALADLRARAEKYPFRADFLALVDSLPDLDLCPTSLIHSDIGPHNAMRTPDGEIVIIDWDDAGLGSTVLDPAYALICQFVRPDLVLDLARARAFYEGYLSVRPLTPIEADCFFGAALFWALDYLDCFDMSTYWQFIQFAVAHREELLSTVLLA